MQRHGLDASRALGQNFVVDPNTVRRIARLAAVGPGDRVVEIGPGLGSLTLALVETGASVIAIEVDRFVLPALEEVLTGTAVKVLHEDARALDWDEVLDGEQRCVLVANLPYNIATGLVLDLLRDVPRIERMLVMVQAEVAERLTAPAGSRTYGIPSVKLAMWASARIVGRVGPEVFHPRPRVESALVEIRRLDEPAVTADPGRFVQVVEKAFNQRRKMLRRSLAGVVEPAAFDAAGLDASSRPEQLSVADWDRLLVAEARLGTHRPPH